MAAGPEEIYDCSALLLSIQLHSTLLLSIHLANVQFTGKNKSKQINQVFKKKNYRQQVFKKMNIMSYCDKIDQKQSKLFESGSIGSKLGLNGFQAKTLV